MAALVVDSRAFIRDPASVGRRVARSAKRAAGVLRLASGGPGGQFCDICVKICPKNTYQVLTNCV